LKSIIFTDTYQLEFTNVETKYNEAMSKLVRAGKASYRSVLVALSYMYMKNKQRIRL